MVRDECAPPQELGSVGRTGCRRGGECKAERNGDESLGRFESDMSVTTAKPGNLYLDLQVNQVPSLNPKGMVFLDTM